MSKLSALIYSLFFIFVPFNTNANTNDTEIPPLPLDAHLSEPYTDDLHGLLQKKYIRVLTTISRTNFFIHDGHLVGYEYSLLKGFQEFLNKNYNSDKLKIVFEFIPVARDELIPKLVNGYGDIAAAGLTITEKRKKSIAFSDPYLTNINELVVTPTNSFYPEKVEDLSRNRVYVSKSSSYHQSLTSLNKRFVDKNINPVIIVPLSDELETESILEMVDSRLIGFTVADSHIAKAWSKVLDNIKIHEDVTLRSGGEIAWMVRRNNPELLEAINKFIKTHKKGTLLGNIYFQRYYNNSERLTLPKDLEKWPKMEKYKKIIKKYSSKYDFDWLLILALAFQESGLDQNKRNKSGAVGVMQILPSTAKDKNINIENVENLENNIHAGVKYLDFLRDHYYNDDNISPRDQVRMSLAAYNAGPAKIRRARDLAAKMGLNPNKWFRNVELAALRIIGQETVRYVSNINKYYVLYSILTPK